MCNPDDHPVDFEVYQTPMDSGNQFFGFQYTGNILNNNLVSYHLFLKDSLSTPLMKMWLHNDSNAMLRFVLPMMKIRHAYQAVLNQQPQQQRPQQQPRPLKKSLEILLNVTQYGIRATIRKHVATIVMIILLSKEMWHAHYQSMINNAILILSIITETVVIGMQARIARMATLIIVIWLTLVTPKPKDWRPDFSVPFAVVPKKPVQSVCSKMPEKLDSWKHSDPASRS